VGKYKVDSDCTAHFLRHFFYLQICTIGRKRWNLISPGSILATFLTLASTIGFSYWVTHFGNYNKAYGSIGTVMIIMLLINFNSLILLIGFELNVSITFLQRAAEAEKIAEKNSTSLAPASSSV